MQYLLHYIVVPLCLVAIEYDSVLRCSASKHSMLTLKIFLPLFLVLLLSGTWNFLFSSQSALWRQLFRVRLVRASKSWTGFLLPFFLFLVVFGGGRVVVLVLCKWLFARFFLKREALLLIIFKALLLPEFEQALIILELRGHSWPVQEETV